MAAGDFIFTATPAGRRGYVGLGFAGGFTLGLKALIGAILGGIGSARAAMLGGLALALFEALRSS